jgi:DNA invertase Pin-like site-specific DNA recombinase
MARRQTGDKLARYLNSATPREIAVRTAAPAGRVFGYCRVSTVQQADEGESLEVQQRTIAGYATMHGLQVEQVFVEPGVSGSKPLADRPQGGALLAVLRPGDVVITPKLDRMFRSALDALDVLGKLKKAGVSLHMIDLGGDVTGNGVSRLVFTILSAVAEAERDRTRERITEVKRDQRQRGRYLGGAVPWGYRVGEAGALEPIPEQQAALKRMRKLREQGLALRAIADRMKAAGVSISHVGVKNALVAAERGAA